MRPLLAIFVVLAALAPTSVHAQVSGGTTPTDRTAVAPGTGSGSAGGSGAAGGSAPAAGATGGHTPGRPFRIPPTIRSFAASPAAVTWGGPPTILRFRVDAVAMRSVRMVLSVQRRGERRVRKVSLGRVRTGRSVARRWARAGVSPGVYRLTLRAVDARGRSLARAARATITVRVRPRPKPAPAPAPSPAPTPAPASSGVFPVRGPHSFGDGFGVDRGDHKHNGVDIAAASGTPLVSPRRGTVTATGYGAAMGYYVVVKDAERDLSYVYFHLLAGSTVVREGQTVAAGQRIGSVGSTGRSTGPHLHFELWAGGWWNGGRAIDPLPSLRAWS